MHRLSKMIQYLLHLLPIQYQPIIFDYSITDNNGTSDAASVTVSITCDEYRTQGIEFVCINAGSF